MRFGESAERVITDQTQQKNPDTGRERHHNIEPGRKRHSQGHDDQSSQQQQDRAVDIDCAEAVIRRFELPVPVDESQENDAECSEYTG